MLAGPGAGKTRMLTHRVAHLIAERGVAAENCLAITFTRRAASEMRERLARILPAGADSVPVHTFHSFGLSILRGNPEAARLAPGFRIAGEAERVAGLAAALDVPERTAARFLRRISRAKRGGVEEIDENLATAIAAYSTLLTANNWVDFDDLVGLAGDALARDETRLARTCERYRFVSVDELQDVDEQQYRLLRLIAPAGGNLCVIGDPDQAIYGFRGAGAAAFERFRRDYPTAATMALKRNYRSSGNIVAAASQVIACAHKDTPFAEIVRDMHEKVAIHAAPSENAEAEFVVATIERLIGGHSFFSIDSGRAADGEARDLAFCDIAVLYRTEAQSAALVEALARSGMPFKTSGAARPAESQLLAEGAESDRARALEAVALANDVDIFDPRADRIALLTMHAAKGLEFPVVFIVGLEDGLVPLRFGPRDSKAESEERRLFYVAMTRAEDLLFLTRAEQRFWRGRPRKLRVSPFLADIEAELLRLEQRTVPRRKPEVTQLALF